METLNIPKEKLIILDEELNVWKYGKQNPFRPLYIADIIMFIQNLFSEELKQLTNTNKQGG